MKIILAFILFFALAECSRYEGYKIYELIVRDRQKADVLDSLRANTNYNFLTDIQALNFPIHVLVAPEYQNDFTTALKINSIQYGIVDENVERKIRAERERLAKAPRLQQGRISFSEYHRYDVIQEYLEQLAVDYPTIARFEIFGTSLEGRPLSLLRLGSGSNDNPTIVIESGIHAREWIAPAVTTYIIQQLVENPNNSELVENINWIIVPVLNPDGYEYTFTDDRMWRKTRRPGTQCDGVDGNRNFDFQWLGPGASTNECSEAFAGPYALSEPEVAAFAEIALAAENPIVYLSVHSFGNWLLFPWGWTSELHENNDELQQVGDAVAAAIAAVNGTIYTVGNTVELLYFAAGNSQDWAASIGIPLSYTIELPAGNGGFSGFVVPPERILPISEETWAGIVTYGNYVIERWNARV